MGFRRCWALLVSLTACTPSLRFDQVESPSYWYTLDDGRCGRTLVVDREGNVWGEGGCETSPTDLKKRGELSAGDFRALAGEFDRLPASKSFKTCKGVEHQFRRVRGASEEAWAACVPAERGREATALPEPYRKLALLFGAAERGR